MSLKNIWIYRNFVIAVLCGLAVLFHFILDSNFPYYVLFVLGGGPQIFELLAKSLKKEFDSDLLAGISIVTAILLGEYLAGVIVVFMLSGGKALEDYATTNASSVLKALAKRLPSVARLKRGNIYQEVPLDQLKVGDVVAVFPHESCPVDGVVVDGRGHMDESYLTGEPFEIEKTIGSSVLSGAVNGDTVLTIQVEKIPSDSRYAKIMKVMQESEKSRPRIRRLADQLGAFYTPLAVMVALIAWAMSGDPIRFLSVLVVATPCPLLIAIPIAIIGSISLAAKRSIIIKSPTALEQISKCETAIFDKTGTLTYGEPKLTDFETILGVDSNKALMLVASLEKYSKHPLASAILKGAKERGLELKNVEHLSEPPGQGLTGYVDSVKVQITGRKKLSKDNPKEFEKLPPTEEGLECVVLFDDKFVGVMRFRDAPRDESKSFVSHLGPKHKFKRVMIVSGDRESEVKYLASQVGIDEIYASQTPEQKLEIVRSETSRAKTLYVGDGINDAPAMMAVTVGMALGQNSEVTSEAAAVVILDNSLKKVDEFIHISNRLRSIALQSAVGGMLLSFGGMMFAASGYLSPVAGAMLQEAIDVLAILNALRASTMPKDLSDFGSH